MALFILVLIAEAIMAVGAYYLFRKAMKNKPLILIAVAASLVGLIAGWVVGYRAVGNMIATDYLKEANKQTIQARGTPITIEEEAMLKEKLIAEPQLEYILHKAAATHALPAFLIVVIAMVVKSKKPNGKRERK